MKRFPPNLAATAVLALFAATTHAAPPSAAALTRECANPRDAQAFDAAFTAATVQRHSLPALTCAAGLSYAMATRNLGDEDLQVLALDSQINLLEAVQKQLDTQTYQGGEAYDDLKGRWALGLRQGQALSSRLQKAGARVPSIAGLRIAFELVSVSSQLVAPDVAYRTAAKSFKPLTELLEKHPQLLDGVGEMMLGRLYFQLPETSGGDLDQAVVHLEKAHRTARRNIEFQRWYAEALIAVDRKSDAREVLARMLPLQPEPIDLQRHADELRAAVGLAQRAGDEALATQLAAKRSALFKVQPALLTRAPMAVMGHGGADPLTGKSED